MQELEASVPLYDNERNKPWKVYWAINFPFKRSSLKVRKNWGGWEWGNLVILNKATGIKLIINFLEAKLNSCKNEQHVYVCSFLSRCLEKKDC